MRTRLLLWKVVLYVIVSVVLNLLFKSYLFLFLSLFLPVMFLITQRKQHKKELEVSQRIKTKITSKLN